jgi:hypothetical protein
MIKMRDRAGGVAQVVEYLPIKCETLSSNSCAPKQNKMRASCRVFKGWLHLGQAKT